MNYMFYNCGKIRSIDISNFDTSSVTKMSLMFAWSSNLNYVNLSTLNTSKVISFSSMFNRCSKLISLDLLYFYIIGFIYLIQLINLF